MPYTWDRPSRRWRETESGTYVSALTVRNAGEFVLQAQANAMRSAAQVLVEGKVSLAEWEGEMAQLIKFTHAAEALAASGGQLSPDMEREMAAVMREQIAFLSRFAGQIYTGAAQLNAFVPYRASLYAWPARSTYERIRRIAQKEIGVRKGRRQPHGTNHCDGCLGEIAEGYKDIDKLTPLGGFACRMFDQCTFDYLAPGVLE